MAARQPFTNSAFVKVEIDFTSNWNTLTPTYTDVTDDLRFSSGLVWERGRNDEFQVIAPGTSQFSLSNRTRTYDATTNANIVPARPARITCYYPTTATAFQQMDLQVEDFVPRYPGAYDSYVQVNCIEGFGGFAMAKIVSSAFISTTAVARLNDLLGGWGGPTSFTAGSYALTSGQVYQNVDVLSSMQAVAAGQAQVLYQDRNGTLVTWPMFNSTSVSGSAFGDGGGAELPFVEPQLSVGQGYWYTQVQLTAANGPGGPWTQNQPNTVTVNLPSPYSSGKFGTRPYTASIAATSQVNAQSAAQSIATRLGNLPSYRMRQVTIRPLAAPSVLFPVVLATDLGTQYTFSFQPIGGGSRISFSAKVRSIRHEINENDWLVTWQLSP